MVTTSTVFIDNLDVDMIQYLIIFYKRLSSTSTKRFNKMNLSIFVLLVSLCGSHLVIGYPMFGRMLSFGLGTLDNVVNVGTKALHGAIATARKAIDGNSSHGKSAVPKPVDDVTVDVAPAGDNSSALKPDIVNSDSGEKGKAVEKAKVEVKAT